MDQDKAVLLQSLGKRFPFRKRGEKGRAETFWAVKDLFLEVERGEVLGIVGRNGSGKTTLLNLIAGILSPTKGEVLRRGKIIGLFNLGVGFEDALTGRENIFLNASILGAPEHEAAKNLDEIILFSEIENFIDMPLGTYSQGMRLRLAFSIVAHLNFDTLVLDEVLAVGDILFRDKCLRRLLAFKEMGRTLIVSSQDLDLMERLADRIVLLDHGRQLFCGEPGEALRRYRGLLDEEAFFVGPDKPDNPKKLFYQTPKRSEDKHLWGKKLGVQEVVITGVAISSGDRETHSIESGDPLKIAVRFFAKKEIKQLHFGVAVFREDGVYVDGPNTGFDGYGIRNLQFGEGGFSISFDRILLEPGNYNLSVAIWNPAEDLAFDYHAGFYPLEITGYPQEPKGLARMAICFKIPFLGKGRWKREKREILRKFSAAFDQGIQQGEVSDGSVLAIHFLDENKKRVDKLRTNQPANLLIEADGGGRKCCVWTAIFTEDGVLCQSLAAPLWPKGRTKIHFPQLSLLPGAYYLSAGLWSSKKNKFLFFQSRALLFQMVHTRPEHGTVALPHEWHFQFSANIHHVPDEPIFIRTDKIVAK